MCIFLLNVTFPVQNEACRAQADTRAHVSKLSGTVQMFTDILVFKLGQILVRAVWTAGRSGVWARTLISTLALSRPEHSASTEPRYQQDRIDSVVDSVRRNALLGLKCLSSSRLRSLLEPISPLPGQKKLTSLYTYHPPPDGSKYLIQRAPGQLLNSANVDLEKISKKVKKVQDLQSSKTATGICEIIHSSHSGNTQQRSRSHHWLRWIKSLIRSCCVTSFVTETEKFGLEVLCLTDPPKTDTKLFN